MTIRTALLEARLIMGDEALFDRLRARFEREIVAKTASEFVAAKLAERDARVKRAGESRYLVEPNVKEGKGGLRDLNTLFWIAKYVYRVRNAEELVPAGLFSHRGIRAVLALRGVSLGGALPPAFSHRARRGAPELRSSTPDRRTARLRRARRPNRRRTLHEALFPRRQGCRRSHGDRLRRARGAARQADPSARSLPRPAAPPTARPRRSRRFQGRARPHRRDRRRRVRARSHQSHPSLLGRRPVEFGDPSRRGAAGHAVAQTHRRQVARQMRKPTGCSWKS